VNIRAAMKTHYLQPSVGHHGVFNGYRFRAQIAPRIAASHARIDALAGPNGATRRKSAKARA
jgi:poly(3-hydroxybutyrate) depolymerase